MTRYVVDASVAVKWCFDEEHSSAALRIRTNASYLHVPEFFILECANAICKKIRRAEVQAAEGLESLQHLRRIPMVYHDDGGLFPNALDVALIIRRSLYDCLYLALAVELDCQFVTADLRFLKAAKKSEFAHHALWVEDLLLA